MAEELLAFLSLLIAVGLLWYALCAWLLLPLFDRAMFWLIERLYGKDMADAVKRELNK